MSAPFSRKYLSIEGLLREAPAVSIAPYVGERVLCPPWRAAAACSPRSTTRRASGNCWCGRYQRTADRPMLYPMRQSDLFLRTVAAASTLLLLSAVDAGLRARAAAPVIAQRSALVAALDLTDLALFTEARYTRHPSQADLHSAFQDHPMALEHFPTGSLVPAPNPGRPLP